MTRPAGVKGVLDELLSALGLSTVASMVRLQAAWPGIAGPLLAGKTSPARLRNGVLTLHVLNHAWAQELRMEKSLLIERINRTVGGDTVQDIRFLVGPLPVDDDPSAPEDAEPPAPRSLPDPEGIAAVGDPETRDILRSLARKASARKR